jgi:ArsR family transcriptional regulator
MVVGNIDVCQCVPPNDPIEELPMARTTLALLNQPSADVCCAPLATSVIDEVDAEVLAQRFAALSDPVRLRLVSLLANADAGAVCACDLVEPVGKSQPTVSHHLKVLSQAGLVTSERRGRNIWYSVVPAAMESLRTALAAR